MKLNCKRIDFTYIPSEEIFNFPEESGLPFLFDVEEELTGDPAAMDAVGKMLDEAEKLAEKAKTAIKAALADEDSRYHSVVTFFMEFHRDDVGPDIAAELFPGTDPDQKSGKTQVSWNFTMMPSEEWKNKVGQALLEYAQGTGSWTAA